MAFLGEYGPVILAIGSPESSIFSRCSSRVGRSDTTRSLCRTPWWDLANVNLALAFGALERFDG